MAKVGWDMWRTCNNEAWGKEQGGAQGGRVLNAGKPQAIAPTKAWVSHPNAASAHANDSSKELDLSSLTGQEGSASVTKASYLCCDSEG